MGIDSNRWIAIICGLLLISFFVSCNPQDISENSPLSLSENLQIDGYGHISDTAVIDVDDDPITCNTTEQQPTEHVCTNGTVWKCHVPQEDPLSSQMIRVDVYSLYDNLDNMTAGISNLNEAEYTVPCNDEYEEGQNCPLLDCYLNDGEGEDEIGEIILTEEQILQCLAIDIRTREKCREYWVNQSSE